MCEDATGEQMAKPIDIDRLVAALSGLLNQPAPLVDGEGHRPGPAAA